MLESLNFLKERIFKDKTELTNNYKELPKLSNGCFTGIDGGSCIIADGGSWIISKIRIAVVHYDKGERVVSNESKKDYYYTLIKNKGFEHYIEGLPKGISISVNEKDAKELIDAPAIIMRTLELIEAINTVKKLPKNSLLVLDGLLTGETSDQEKALKVLEAEAKNKEVNVIGIAKTFRHAINGKSVIGSLLKQNPNKSWIYAPVEGTECFIAKMHERASYAYALSAFKHTKIEDVLPILTFYSRDPELIGYPYPLLKADRDARISSYEKRLEMNKLKILSKKEGFDFIEYDEKSTSMHSVMDSGKYR